MLRRLKECGIACATDKHSRFAASLDQMRYSFLPDAVVYAKSEADVSETMKAASDCGVPITVRGSGTGCAGGCVPTCGGVVLDMSGIDFIEIDAVSRMAHVGAGAITANVDEAANKFGLFYAPDPSSHKFSSIGGNIACNAGGLRALKYGTTRENVLALKAVLADGRAVSGALPLKKYSVGINLARHFHRLGGHARNRNGGVAETASAPEVAHGGACVFQKRYRGVQGRRENHAGKPLALRARIHGRRNGLVHSGKTPRLRRAANSAAILAEFDDDDSAEQARKFAQTLSPEADAKIRRRPTPKPKGFGKSAARRRNLCSSLATEK